MSKKYCLFLSALFCAFLAVFLTAGAVTPDRTMSELENRSLQQLPVPSAKTVLSGEFMSDFETYCNDQFALRDQWVAMKSFSELATGKGENNGVYFGRDDTLISRFDSPDPQRVATNLGYVDQFVENAGIPVYLSLIPGAASVWADRLPDGAPNADQKAVIDEIAGKTSARFYDSYQALWDHREEDVYYRTDHHWTSLGAYYGYTSLMDALGMEAAPLSSFQKQTVSDSFYGTAFSTAGARWIAPDDIDIYVPDPGVEVTSWFSAESTPGSLYCWNKLEGKDKYTFFLGGNQSKCVVKNPNVQGPKLLLLRDSYSDSLVPYLTAHFSEIHLIDLRYYRYSIPQYIRDNGIDTAVILYSVSNFVTDANFFTLRQK